MHGIGENLANYSLPYTMHTIMLKDYTNNTNLTQSTSRIPEEKSIDLRFINVIIAIIIIIVNSFVVFLFCYKRNLLNTPSHRLLLSLAVCDFLTGTAIFLHVCLQNYCRHNVCTSFSIWLEIFTTFLVETVILHLCGITSDRFFSLFHALRYREIVTKKKTAFYIIFAWSLPFFASAIQLCWLYKVIGGKASNQENEEIAKIEVWYSMISFLIFFVVPMALLGFAFLSMFLEIRRLLLKTPNLRNRDVSGISLKQRRVVYIFGCMYICFFIFSLPYFSLRILVDLSHSVTVKFDEKKIYLAWPFTYSIKSMTSLTNPIIYTAINREFRSLIIQVFKRVRNSFRKFPFRKLSSQTSFLNVSMRRRSMPITSAGDSSMHESGMYEISIHDHNAEVSMPRRNCNITNNNNNNNNTTTNNNILHNTELILKMLDDDVKSETSSCISESLEALKKV